MNKRKLNIVMQVLQKKSVEYPDTKDLIEEHLEQECLKENVSVEEVTSFLLTSFEANS